MKSFAKSFLLIFLFLCFFNPLFGQKKNSLTTLLDSWNNYQNTYSNNPAVSKTELIAFINSLEAFVKTDSYIIELNGEKSESAICIDKTLEHAQMALAALSISDYALYQKEYSKIDQNMNDFLILLLASESDLIMPFVELLTIISILFFIISFGGIFYIKNKRAAERLEVENQKEILITKIISQVQENERNRIARDLHDTVIQDTRTALLYARQLEQHEERSDAAEAAEKIRMLEERNMLNIRSIIRNLNPPEIESAEFEHLIKDFARNAQEMSGIDFKVYTQASDYLKKLSIEQKLHIYRIIQESVNNAIKHASPSEISIIVREEENKSDNKNSKSLVFIISDDGKGFDVDVSASESEEDKLTETGTHLGLRGMKSRALILGAELSIKSSQDWGTQIKLTINITD